MIMRLRLATLLVGLSVLGLSAQEPTSVVLKNGERFSGQLVDLGAPGFTFEVNGAKRTVPKNDVVSIDFRSGDLPRPDQLSNMGSGQSAVVLNSGEVVVGEFYDIGGTVPLRVTFRTATGQRDYQSSDIRAIWVSKPAEATAQASTSGAAGGQTVTVQARQRWTPTNITVKRGQTVRFETKGEVTVNTRSRVLAPPAGNTSIFDDDNPVPAAPTGALVGQVGVPGRTGSLNTFVIGDRESVTMPADGVLLLGINDTELGDNSGMFEVRVAPEQ
jgi:plastocyanin